MGAHTPGPGVAISQPVLGTDPVDFIRIEGDGVRVAGVSADEIAEDGEAEVCSKTAFANARLIAAAPELLAALEGVMNAPMSTKAMFAAHAAIAKARGAK